MKRRLTLKPWSVDVMVTFLSGMMDLEVGYIECHETISKKVIRPILIDLDWKL